MPVQPRTRITLFLPAPTLLREHFLVDEVLSQFISVCDGVTITQDLPPVIKGLWRDDQAHQTIEDLNVLIIGDAPMRADDTSLLEYLGRLKRRCQDDFEQTLIWVTIHPIERISDGDPL